VVDASSVRAVRIVDTLHCSDLWVSDAVLADLETDHRLVVLASSLGLHRSDGRLAPFGGS
jgi:hypothetical protein